MKYRTVVIDPPWRVGAGLEKLSLDCYRIARPLPYDTMTDSEIMAFPINDFADKECDLFLWTTHTKLPLALSILQAWGFKYHALMSWDKQKSRLLYSSAIRQVKKYD